MSRWRRDRDSNPGYLAVYTLSKRAPSATRPSLREVVGLIESNTVELASLTKRSAVDRSWCLRFNVLLHFDSRPQIQGNAVNEIAV